MKAITNINDVPADYVSVYQQWPGLEGNNVRNWAFAGVFRNTPMKLVKLVGGKGGAVYVNRAEAEFFLAERRSRIEGKARRAAEATQLVITTQPKPVQGRLLFDSAPQLEDGSKELLTTASETPQDAPTLCNVITLLEYQNRTLAAVLEALKTLATSFDAAWNTNGGAK